jgi:hypothetical protein
MKRQYTYLSVLSMDDTSRQPKISYWLFLSFVIYLMNQTIPTSHADTLKPKAYVSYSDGAGGYFDPLYSATYIGWTPGATINLDAFDLPYMQDYPGLYFYTIILGERFGVNYHGVGKGDFETPHVVFVETEYDSPNGGKEEYKFSPYGNRIYTNNLVGLITKESAGVNARDPN